MRLFRSVLCIGLFCLAVSARAGQAGSQSPSGPVLRTETRLVLVDTVVTDKKGNYLHDLTAKDFRVWEDNKEQTIANFNSEAGSSAAAARAHYLVVFFDNTTMDSSTRLRARRAAAQFIEMGEDPSRQMAIVQFAGTLRIAQNFTSDAARLKKVLENSGTGPRTAGELTEVASIGAPRLNSIEADFGARSVLLGLRSLAKNLGAIPGRKTLVLFTAGFSLSAENQSELTAVINVCNRANVAVYPIDARGLTADLVGPRSSVIDVPSTPAPYALNGYVQAASFIRPASYTVPGLAFQRGGAPGGGSAGGGQSGGGGGGGSRGPGGIGGGGGSTGNTGGGMGRGSGGGMPGGGSPGGGGRGGNTGGNTGGNAGGAAGKGGTTGGNTGGNTSGRGGTATGGGTNNNNNNMRNDSFDRGYQYNPFDHSRMIVPALTQGPQPVLYALAEGTGGFVIVNSNDLAGGLKRIGREQNEYYILGYSAPESEEGSCHTLKVKVNRGGTTVRARSGYCNVKPADILAGKPLEKELESRASDPALAATPASSGTSMRAPFFYTGPGVARVNVAIEIPAALVKVEKVKGKLQASINVLGIAYRNGGAVAARFSDTVKLDFENKKDVEKFAKEPFHYENQFEIAAGQYNLVVVYNPGSGTYGRAERPLVIEPYDGKQLAISDLALSKAFRPAADVGLKLDAALLEGRTPLIARGTQFTPSGTHRFKKDDNSVVYFEIYEPLLAEEQPPKVGVQVRVIDRKSGEPKQDSGIISAEPFIQAGNPVVPVGVKLQAALPSGAYRAEIRAVDSSGRTTSLRTAEFELE